MSDIISEAQEETVSIAEFSKMDLRVARVIGAERVPGSDKLLKLIIDLGGDKRELIAGVGASYSPEELLEKNIIVIANILPRTFRLREGPPLVSQGMLLAADADGQPIILTVERPVPPGTKIK
ncbi:MAG: methionine--tRNA ligase [Candidatus Micrarchaeota archaeon]|nr:methionine--tRNA ligase [Candidatus Micrarchaeota archaeon]